MNRKYRKTIIAGNWKMNMTAAETAAFAETIKPLLPKSRACEAVLCLPALNITAAQKAFRGCRISVGAQTLHEKASGAYTGEQSAAMLADAGVKYVIIGHSERRQYYNETDFTVNAKIKAALAAGLTPIVCVGESLEQREAGVQNELLSYQIAVAVSGLSAQEMKKIVIAYEPIWAIGTGNTATSEQAQEMCQHIRAVLREKFDGRTARGVSILYGGSMNVKNAQELLSMPDIDGGLIGGASLKPTDYAQLVTFGNGTENA